MCWKTHPPDQSQPKMELTGTNELINCVCVRVLLLVYDGLKMDKINSAAASHFFLPHSRLPSPPHSLTTNRSHAYTFLTYSLHIIWSWNLLSSLFFPKCQCFWHFFLHTFVFLFLNLMYVCVVCVLLFSLSLPFSFFFLFFVSTISYVYVWYVSFWCDQIPKRFYFGDFLRLRWKFHGIRKKSKMKHEMDVMEMNVLLIEKKRTQTTQTKAPKTERESKRKKNIERERERFFFLAK